MSEYYAVTRSNNHLAHYGIKGMKWGVRKAIALGDSKKLNKEFNKAAKKLSKLQDKALNSGKYAAKAAAYGAAAAGTGALTVGGTGLIKSGLKSAGKAIEGVGRAMEDSRKHTTLGSVMRRTGSGMTSASDAIEKWGNKKPKPTYKKVAKRVVDRNTGKSKVVFINKQIGNPATQANAMSNDTKFKIGAGVVTAGLGAAAARNAYIASNSRKYLNKANNFKQAMDDTFAGTKYAGQYIATPKIRKTTSTKKRRNRS